MKEERKSFLLEPPTQPQPSSLAFLRQMRFCLLEEYWTKIKDSVDLLNEEQVWWRPNEESNSVGNLILHLSGNLRQWIIAGIGGAVDVRDRPREFAQRDPVEKAELLKLLKSTLDEVDAVMARIEKEVVDSSSDAPLQLVCQPQRFPQTVLDAISHVSDHFAYHAGQIVYIAKLLETGKVRFYDDRKL
ncbi:MAG: DUF1572 family protein [Blastocatellia bacterium]|nr:DUF1572 family protein [Blastocatellia bacterium]